MLKYPWQQAVLDAIMEFHADHIREKLNAAERAICSRLRQRPTDLQELVALREALLALQIVFPDTKLKVEPAEKKDIA